MAKDLYIIGAGGMAKEILPLVNDINYSENLYRLKGFIDKSSELKELKIGGSKFPVLEEDFFLEEFRGFDVACCLGIGASPYNPSIIKRFEDFEFPNLVHPNVTGDRKSIKIGKGNLFCSNSQFTVNLSGGDFNIFNRGSQVGHDVEIGSFNLFNPGSIVSGSVSIGDSNLIGAGSVILQNLKIKSNSILGAGAVLTKDLESNVMAMGVPAKVVNNP